MDKLTKLLVDLFPDNPIPQINHAAETMRENRIDFAQALYDLPTHKERMDTERAAQNGEVTK